MKQITDKYYDEAKKRTRQKRVATDTWRSLGCRTTPLEHWSRRKPTVEPRCSQEACIKPTFPYHFTHIANQRRISVKPAEDNLIENLISAESCILKTYRLTKTKATEVLVFMLSDLGRIYKPEFSYSVRIAYGLQGRSLTTTVMRKRLRHVLSECVKRGLYIQADNGITFV